MTRLLGLLGALALLALAPATAGAHAVLLTTEPASGSVVQEAPGAVYLHFNEPVETSGGALAVAAGDGSRVDQGPIGHSDGGKTVRVGLKSGLKNGSYSVAWRVTSADSHVVQGAFVFSIGEPGPTFAGALLPPQPTGGRAGGIATRFLQFAGLLGTIGIAAFLLGVWGPLVRAARPRVAQPLDAAETTFTRWATIVAIVAGAALAVGSLLAIPVQAWQSEAPVGDVLGTRFGHVGIARLALLVVAIPLLLLAVRRPLDPRRAVLTLVFAVPLAFLPGLAGHASTAGTPLLAEAIDGLHVTAAGIWSGGLLMLAVALGTAVARVGPDDRRPFMLGTARRFTRLAVASVAVIVTTGTIAGIRELDGLGHLFDTTYGQVLLLKILVVAAALCAALVTRRVRPTFVRDVRVEAALVLLAVGLTAGLTGLAPGSAAQAAPVGPFSLNQAVGPHQLAFDIQPARAGVSNEVHLVVTNAVGQPAFDVTDATLTLSLPSAGIEDLPVPLQLLTTAHWAGSIVLPQPGRWDVKLLIRRGTFDADEVHATMPVSK